MIGKALAFERRRTYNPANRIERVCYCIVSAKTICSPGRFG
jgi:hypothetical protein